MRLLDPLESIDSAPRWSWWESSALALYLAVVSFGIAQHIPWADESQAWMLAHDVSLPYLLTHSLHYEGTPGLWHSYLKLLQAFHLSFTAARWISGGVAALGVVVLLRWAPFPRIVRLLLPFSFFLAYQDALIARSYVLFALPAFTAAAMLRSARARPLLLALLLGLMAQISVHAALASGGLALVAAGLWWRQLAPQRARSAGAILLLLAFWAGAVACMAPAPDIDYPAGNNFERSFAKVEDQLGAKKPLPALLSEQKLANLPPVPPAVHVRKGFAGTWNKLSRLLSVITYPLSTARLLALLLVGLVIAQACVRPTGSVGVLGLVPYLLVVAVFTSLYLAPRHAGIVFTTFVVTAWLTWPEPCTGKRLLLGRATAAVFALALVVQISWTIHALRNEHTLAYSPDRMTANYLQQRQAGSKGHQTAGFYYYSVGPLLYFDRNLYFNQPPHRYWLWSTQMRTYSTVQQVLAQRPELIVVGGSESGPDAEITRDWQPITPPLPGVKYGDGYLIADYFRQHGYHDARVFCGSSWMRSSYAERLCIQVLERDGTAH